MKVRAEAGVRQMLAWGPEKMGEAVWALGEVVLFGCLVLVVAGEEHCASLSTTEKKT